MKTQEEEETVCIGVLHVSSRAGWACHMIECTEPYHALRECGFFRSLSTGERTRRVRRLKLCEGCLTFGHSTGARSCPFRREDDGLCSVRKCGKGHHSLLHDDGVKESTSPQDVEREEEVTCSSGMAARKPRTAYDTMGQGQWGSLLPRVLGSRLASQLGDHPVCTRKEASPDGKELPETQWPGVRTRTEGDIPLQSDTDAYRRSNSGAGRAWAG